MKIVMHETKRGSANANGSAAMSYEKDERYTMEEDWQIRLAKIFIDNKWAREIKPGRPPREHKDDTSVEAAE